MDTDVALILLQEGIVNGAVYALLALSLVLVFAVTRVILIPQGEIVAFGALTYAALDEGRVPGSPVLLVALGALAFLLGLFRLPRARRAAAALRLAGGTLLLPLLVLLLVRAVAPLRPGAVAAAALTVLVVAPMGPLLYRVAFRPLAEASVLVLLIASVGVHLALSGLGLVVFGPEGFRASGFSDAAFEWGGLRITGQALWVLGATAALIAALYAFFGLTLFGRALRATAVNRLGARLVGIAPSFSGQVAFGLAGVIGALSGVLLVPLTTVGYDSGFLIGLKGFVAAVTAGLASYPGAALAALALGVVESFASFWASAFKEVIVFTSIIPVLLWRSLRRPAREEE